MPNTTSAKKALRQNKTRYARNLTKKTSYKKVLKEYRKLAHDKKTSEAQALLSKLFKSLDKAAKTKVIKHKKASRLKSRAAQLIAKASKASS